MAHATRANVGYLLAKAAKRWNDVLEEAFARAGYPEVRASFGSVLIPLFEEDGLRMGEIARRASLSKQTMTTLVRLCEREGLVRRNPDPADGRASVVLLTPKAERFGPVVEQVLERMERDVVEAIGERRLAGLRASLAELG
ncbi:MAG TPA: MarR family transcriptional regulator [Thermoleophilaceae bacterium]|nr:MarR family transcriptional regulator [Thermoleophilaceae bacterium]